MRGRARGIHAMPSCPMPPAMAARVVKRRGWSSLTPPAAFWTLPSILSASRPIRVSCRRPPCEGRLYLAFDDFRGPEGPVLVHGALLSAAIRRRRVWRTFINEQVSAAPTLTQVSLWQRPRAPSLARAGREAGADRCALGLSGSGDGHLIFKVIGWSLGPDFMFLQARSSVRRGNGIWRGFGRRTISPRLPPVRPCTAPGPA